MPRGYWRIGAAAIGLIIAGTLGYAGIQFYNAAEQRNARYDYQPAREPRLPIAVENEPQTQPYQPYCDNPQRREDADLCAQWAAVAEVSEANRLVAVNTRLSIFLLFTTALGTGLLLWTLHETRLTARRQLRAYISVDAKGVVKSEDNPEIPESVAFAVTNTGQTPAYNVCVFAQVALSEKPMADFDIFADIPEYLVEDTDRCVGAGITHHTYTAVGLSREQIAAVAKRSAWLICVGKITYRDVFSFRRSTHFCFYFSGPDFGSGGARFHERGNNAT